jgi:peptidoglycan-associated lipoprotein
MRFFYRLLFLFFVFSAMIACTYTEKVTTGEVAMKRKQYAVAIELLEKEFYKAQDAEQKRYKALQMGLAYDRMGDYSKSLEWYQIGSNIRKDEEVLLMLAQALKKQGKYKEALNLLQSLPMNLGAQIKISAEISALQQSIEWVVFEQKNRIYQLSMLPFCLPNSSQILTGISKKGSFIFSSNQIEEDKAKDKWTGKDVYSLYEFTHHQEVLPYLAFGTKNFHTAMLAYNSKEEEALFTSCDVYEEGNFYCKLYQSRKFGEGWTDPVVLNFCEPKVNYLHAVFHPKDDYIVFSSDLNAEDGEYNLYISHKKGPLWSDPVKLGANINSPYDEVFPTFKGDTLFFSSNKPSGMGGLDIYYSLLLPNQQRSAPINLRYPINSPSDDFGMHLLSGNDSINWKGYFTSNRSGFDNVYFFERNKARENKILDQVAKASMNYYVELQIKTFEKEFNSPEDPLSGIKFRKPLANVGLEIWEGKEFSQRQATNRLGAFVLSPEFSKEYNFVFSKEGYLTNAASFSAVDLAIDSTQEKQIFEIQVVMDKIFLNKEIVLESIFYDFDMWDIREDAKPSLDTLYAMLVQNPRVAIELSSHTDCRGDADYNLKLSQKRADSAVNYLIAKGIKEERIVSKGYGKTLPAVDCKCEECTEEEHQRNRRTSFKIIGL